MTRTPTQLYRELSCLLLAIKNCQKSCNQEWELKHTDSMNCLIRNGLPHGSGFDSGTTIDMEKSNSERLIFHTSFHHTNEYGVYDGWTEHTITVRPSLQSGFTLTVSGRDRNGIKDYIYEMFQYALSMRVWQDDSGNWKSENYHPLPTQ